ncbi:DUF2663 family protein [Sporolactobacillus kofuensis]|uniref:DUF2663 family protein n=1 Tax=Sporolactobacillus kofuensis TaxID=269672 RepID=A0ABW1WHF6_9BACL|nr:DUF2663 family protein [Sporolactobacillus kofuensis]MCO7176622.1 YpbF family protein [Sporolactobacillus kofuensis]
MSLKGFRDQGLIPGRTYTILLELIKRKEKKNKWKQKESVVGLGLMVSSGILITYLFFFHSENLGSIHGFHALIGRPELWLMLFCCLFFMILFTYCHGERVDAEDDFDDLREECIDREEHLWPKEQANAYGDSPRYVILTTVKKDYDINLFYK